MLTPPPPTPHTHLFTATLCGRTEYTTFTEINLISYCCEVTHYPRGAIMLQQALQA